MRRVQVVLLAMVTAAAVHAQVPDRDGLLAAWEASVRDDPATVRFEALGDGRYRYETQRFPYDGGIEVNEVVIDDRGAEGPFGTVTGHVVVDLVDADDEFRRRHATSLGLWESGNTFMWDDDGDGWITVSDWSGRVQEQYGSGWSGRLSVVFWPAMLIGLLVTLWWFSRRANRQMKDAMAQQQEALEQQDRAMRMHEEGLELARESNRLLARILDSLESRGR